MITHIDNVAVWVADLERAERFYVGHLGLDVVARIETPDVRELIVGRTGSGSQLMLASVPGRARSDRLPRPAGVLPPADGPAPVGHWKTFLWSDDIAADVESAVAGGGTVIEAPRTLEAFPLRIAVVTDPDGNLVEFGQQLESPAAPAP